MKQDNILTLCDPHNSIVHEYGCQNSCTRMAAICRKGCSEYQHKQKVSKHQFIHAREFYTLISHLRHDYTTFATDFKEVYLKRFLNEIRSALESFQESILNKIKNEHSLVDIYSKSSGEIFQSILEDKYQDLQFAQLKCKEVFQIKYFYSSLMKSSQQDHEKRVTKILTKLLEEHLRALKLIPMPQKFQKQQKIKLLTLIQGQNIESIVEKTNASAKVIESSQQKDHYDIVLLKIKENLHLHRDSPDMKQKLDPFFQAFKKFLQLVKAEEMTIAVKGIVSANYFWLQFFKFIGTTKIKTLKVITTEQTEQSKSTQNSINLMHKENLAIKFISGDWENNFQSLMLALNK